VNYFFFKNNYLALYFIGVMGYWNNAGMKKRAQSVMMPRPRPETYENSHREHRGHRVFFFASLRAYYRIVNAFAVYFHSRRREKENR
jgi:hypothetical protein